MTDDNQIALDMWCLLALDIPQLDDLDLWQAFVYREQVRQALASGWRPSDDERAALQAGDKLFDDAADAVLPFLHHRDWVDRRPDDHYARVYVARHEELG